MKRFAMIMILPLAASFTPGCTPARAPVPDGCYRFDDGTPLFKIAGGQGFLIAGGRVKSFRIGGWHDGTHKTVEISPAFMLPGLPAGDPRRGVAEPIPSITYSRFAFDPSRNAFEVPIAASGEDTVKLGAPC